jgi:hypothetical protein
MENKVEGGFFLNVMVKQDATVLKLFAREDKALPVGRNASRELAFHIQNQHNTIRPLTLLFFLALTLSMVSEDSASKGCQSGRILLHVRSAIRDDTVKPTLLCLGSWSLHY